MKIMKTKFILYTHADINGKNDVDSIIELEKIYKKHWIHEGYLFDKSNGWIYKEYDELIKLKKVDVFSSHLENFIVDFRVFDLTDNSLNYFLTEG